MPKVSNSIISVLMLCLIIVFLGACIPKNLANSTEVASNSPQSSTLQQTKTALPLATLIYTKTPIITSTKIPTQTSTDLPPLVSHEWHPNETLITFGGSGGDGGCFMNSFPKRLTLFSDGKLFVFDWESESGTYQILFATLSRDKVCHLLNSLDQAGFFDYDPSTYFPPAYASNPEYWMPPIQGAGNIQISIQAWRSNTISLYGLGSFIEYASEHEGEPDYPVILPAIRKTYEILNGYQSNNLSIYHPERLGIWIDPCADSRDTIVWPLTAHKLSEIAPQDCGPWEGGPNLILYGEEAETVSSDRTL